jgi:hypothetical protein
VVQLWERLLSKYADILVAGQRLNIDERREASTRAQSAAMGELLRAVTSDLQLSVAQRAQLPEILTRHIRAIGSVPGA